MTTADIAITTEARRMCREYNALPDTGPRGWVAAFSLTTGRFINWYGFSASKEATRGLAKQGILLAMVGNGRATERDCQRWINQKEQT